MARVLERGPTLRLELFTSDLRASLEFYRRVLGFEKEGERPGGYTPLAKGSVRIALNLRSDLHEDHPIRPATHERPGRGAEADPLERWFSEGTDVRSDVAIAEQIGEFIDRHGAKSVALAEPGTVAIRST